MERDNMNASFQSSSGAGVDRGEAGDAGMGAVTLNS
jgi:hypothetical protein